MTLLRCHFKKLTHHPEKSGKHLMLETFNRKVELGEEIYGRSTRTHEHKFPKKQTFQNHLTFSFTIFYFIEEEEGLRQSVASV